MFKPNSKNIQEPPPSPGHICRPSSQEGPGAGAEVGGGGQRLLAALERGAQGGAQHPATVTWTEGAR